MSPRPVLSTYRLQLGPGFGFAEATAAIPYLAELGVSHLYLSPVVAAAPGSTHGYDGVDPDRLSPELGGDEAFASLVDTAHAAGLGLVLDIVPNHLSTVGRTNRWWWDVLTFGPASRYASHFDVDWRSPEERRRDVLVLPVLGDHYGRALDAGHVRLVRDADDLVTVAVYDDTRLPLAPASLGALVSSAAGAIGDATLAFVGRSLVRLGADETDSTAEERWADLRTAVRLALEACERNPTAADALDDAVARTNADLDALDALLDGQHYRLTRWRVALDEPGYRRFFDVNTLVALRTEDPTVFDAVHGKVLSLVRTGAADGLRVDHVDGLAQPTAYCRRLRAEAPDAWLVVEKILAPGEDLRPSWPVDGTTGYEHAALTSALLVDPAGEGPLTEAYQRVTGDTLDWHEHAAAGEQLVLDTVLAGDVARLAELFVRACERRRSYRDVTRRELQRALVAAAVEMPCYRSYGAVGPDGTRQVDDEDRRIVRAAVDGARRREPEVDPAVFDLLHAILGFVATGAEETELALRFQQLTGPARAKGEEDTALYRYTRLLALCDVGHDPGTFSVPPDAFHDACGRAAAWHPRTMVTTSTHDTKRAEDVRARLAVLSEVPERFAAFVDELIDAWPAAVPPDAAALDPAMAWFLAQTVVGAWPIDVERLRAVVEKSMREAKAGSSWLHVDEVYEATVQAHAAALVTDDRLRTLVAAMVGEVAAPGRSNALALATLRCTAPGVPDTYRGTEWWDLSLVDPDNRRAFDLAERRTGLAVTAGRTAAACWADEDDQVGLVKQRWVADLLALRNRRPTTFLAGGYEALEVVGAEPACVTAYRRGDDVCVVVPRWYVTGRARHEATSVELPAGPWRDVATGRTIDGGPHTVAELTASFPVAVLERP